MKKHIILLLLTSALVYGTAFGQTKVDFEIRNAQVVGSNYEFDVYMAADQAGTFHTRGMVYISYNTAAFGTKVNQNGTFTFTESQLLNGQAAGFPKYRTLSPADNADNIVALTWENANLTAAGLTANQALNELNTLMTPLYHVSMQMANPNAAPAVTLHDNLMQGQQFYFTSNNEVAYLEGQVNLPVEYISFTGERHNVHDVNLNWETANEVNNDFFVIEKKRGQNGSFEEIARINSQGNGTDANSYNYLDQTGMANVNFYRLKQVDLDGTANFSQIVEVTMDDLVENDKFYVYPVVAQDRTTLISKVELTDDLRYEITDVDGRTVVEGVLPTSGRADIALTGFAAGTYYVATTGLNGKRYLNRIVKTN